MYQICHIGNICINVTRECNVELSQCNPSTSPLLTGSWFPDSQPRSEDKIQVKPRRTFLPEQHPVVPAEH